jgi:NADPH:quinone reductase-like Zn-dependent oxidoreductase
MKAWWTKTDSTGVTLELRDTPVPQPRAGEVRIRVRAVSLNRGEFLAPAGSRGAVESRIGGSDAAGEVDAIGEGVSGWALGERLMGAGGGAYAEYAIRDPRLSSRIPARLSWEEAAAIPTVFNVTHDMLWTGGQLKPGEWLLVTGISSGVGVACLQAAKAIGARVLGTSGSQAKLDRLMTLGLDVPLRTRAPDFSAAVLAATGGKGANLVVNNVGGSVFAECVKSMAYAGRLAVVGYLDEIFTAELDLDAVHSKRLRLFGVSARQRPIDERVDQMRAIERDLMPAFADGRIRPIVDRVFPFDRMLDAQAFMEGDTQLGKIVVSMG